MVGVVKLHRERVQDFLNDPVSNVCIPRDAGRTGGGSFHSREREKGKGVRAREKEKRRGESESESK